MIKKYLLKTVEYATGEAFNKFLLILLIPIFTKNMLPQEYAVYSNLTIFIAFASLLYSLGIQQSIFSYFYDEKTLSYRFTFINSVVILLFFSNLIFSLLIILGRNFFSVLIVRSLDFGYLFYYIVIIILADSFYTMTLNFLNIMEKSRKFALLSSVKTIVLLILIIFASITNIFSIRTVFLYIMLSAIIAAFISMLYIKSYLKNISNNIEKKQFFSLGLIRNLLKFGFVMIPASLAMLSLRLADRYMITYLTSKNVQQAMFDVGIYSLGYRVGMIMQFAVSLISLVYYPYAMKIAKSKIARNSYKKIFNYYLFGGTILAFFIILFSQEIFHLFVDKRYNEAVKIVAFGVISSYLTGIFNLINISFYIKKKAKSIAVAVGLGSVLNIVLNFLLIPYYGIIGAGIASVIAYIFIVIFGYISSEKIFKIGYKIYLLPVTLLILFIPSIYNIFIYEQNIVAKLLLLFFTFIGSSFYVYRKFGKQKIWK